jgi:hypothetical protein
MAKDRDITITSFSAGQTNTRAKKDFRMSSLLNIELDNFGDSISESILAIGEYWNGGYILGSKVEYELSDKSNFKYSVWLI